MYGMNYVKLLTNDDLTSELELREKEMKRVFTLVGLLLILTIPMAAVSAAPPSTPPPANTPDYVNISWSAGNAVTECLQLTSLTGVTYSYGYKFAPPSGSSTSDGNTIELSNNTGLVFDWSALPEGASGVIVKSATFANIWTYSPQATSDTGLHAFEYDDPSDPVNSLGKYKEVSHITFCWNEGGDKTSADASALVLGCLEGDETEPVVIETKGVVMTVTYPDGVTTFTHPNPVDTGANPDTYKDLPVGTYTLTYQALDGYEIPTDPPLQESFVIGICDSGKESATASAKLGACTWTLGDGSLTPVTITVTNAKMTLNGKLYEPKVSTTAETVEETFDLKLPPGKYPYIWESIDPDLYTGEGQGTFDVSSCVPGEEKQEDPKVDVASSGALPSLLATAAPFLTGTLGMGLSYTVVKRKINQRH